MDEHTFFRTFPSSHSSHSRHQNAKCGGSPLVVRYALTWSEISSGVSRSSAYCFLKRSNASLAAVANPFRQLLRRDEIYVVDVKTNTYNGKILTRPHHASPSLTMCSPSPKTSSTIFWTWSWSSPAQGVTVPAFSFARGTTYSVNFLSVPAGRCSSFHRM